MQTDWQSVYSGVWKKKQDSTVPPIGAMSLTMTTFSSPLTLKTSFMNSSGICRPSEIRETESRSSRSTAWTMLLWRGIWCGVPFPKWVMRQAPAFVTGAKSANPDGRRMEWVNVTHLKCARAHFSVISGRWFLAAFQNGHTEPRRQDHIPAVWWPKQTLIPRAVAYCVNFSAPSSSAAIVMRTILPRANLCHLSNRSGLGESRWLTSWQPRAARDKNGPSRWIPGTLLLNSSSPSITSAMIGKTCSYTVALDVMTVGTNITAKLFRMRWHVSLKLLRVRATSEKLTPL